LAPGIRTRGIPVLDHFLSGGRGEGAGSDVAAEPASAEPSHGCVQCPCRWLHRSEPRTSHFACPSTTSEVIPTSNGSSPAATTPNRSTGISTTPCGSDAPTASGAPRQHLNLLGFALCVNSLALHRHRERETPLLAA
jgi:hypothetical protein